MLRKLEVPRGSVAFLRRSRLVPLRDDALLDSYSTLPIRNSCETKSQYQSSGEAARKNVSPPSGR